MSVKMDSVGIMSKAATTKRTLKTTFALAGKSTEKNGIRMMIY